MRLNRALEEVDKYKRLLEEASEAAKGGQQGAQTDLQRLRMENKKCAPPSSSLLRHRRRRFPLPAVLCCVGLAPPQANAAAGLRTGTSKGAPCASEAGFQNWSFSVGVKPHEQFFSSLVTSAP